GGATSEPTISFGASADPAPAAGGGLDSLSLDSLSLEAESTKVLPPPDFPATRRGPLDRPAAPAPGPGTPGDLWSESADPGPEPRARPHPGRGACRRQREGGTRGRGAAQAGR